MLLPHCLLVLWLAVDQPRQWLIIMVLCGMGSSYEDLKWPVLGHAMGTVAQMQGRFEASPCAGNLRVETLWYSTGGSQPGPQGAQSMPEPGGG